MKTKIRLLQSYDGHSAGELRSCKTAADAEALVSAGIAEYYYENEAEHKRIVDEVADTVRAELKIGSKGRMSFGGGTYAENGFGPISPKAFWLGSGKAVSGGSSSFDNAADFLGAVLKASKGQWNTRLKDISEGTPSEGGFLVPTEMANFVYSEILEDSPFFTMATLLPMTSNTLKVPYVYDIDHSAGMHSIEIPHAVGEGSTLADISPKFGQCQLTLHKIGGRCRVSSEALEDSSQAMSVLLPKIFSDALSFEMIRQFLKGSGGAGCLGILNAPATVTVAKKVGQAADTIVTENIVNMFSRLLPSAQRRCIWMANLDTLPQLLTLTVNVGTGGSYVWLVGGDRSGAGLANSPPLTILGRPIYFTEHSPTLGDEGDICVFNPQAYAIGRKPDSQIRIEVSEQARFENDQSVFRAICRLDGQPLQSAPITPASGSANTLSHFVKLAERGT